MRLTAEEEEQNRRRGASATPRRRTPPRPEPIHFPSASSCRPPAISSNTTGIGTLLVSSCTACHQVQGVASLSETFPKGPELSAVGAGLPLELIIEAVVWPKRQIKEGYELTTLFLDDGRAISGYVISENGEALAIRNLTSGRVERLVVSSIEERVKKGTAMPAGFTRTLTQTELRDLVAYLATLKGSANRAAP